MATRRATRLLPARSVAQLSVLKALLALDRFTIGKLGARAGVPAATLRPLLLRWERQGFPLLVEVGADYARTVGQPPKLYVLAPEMRDKVDAAIAAAEGPPPALVVHSEPPRRGQIDRLNLVTAAKDIVAEAEQTEASARRTELLAEANRLLERARKLLAQREEMGRSGASAELLLGLQSLEQRISFISAPDMGLRTAIMDRTSELRRRALAFEETKQRDNIHDTPEHGRFAAESFTWLTASAKHYLQTGPGGRDNEVAFFGGILIARGELGTSQDTMFDEWIAGIVRGDRKKTRMEPVGLSWASLCDKFAMAIGRMVECGSGVNAWHALLADALEGIRKSAWLAVESAMHAHVAELIARTRSYELRQAGQEFLQQYSIESALLTKVAALELDNTAPLPVASYFVAQAGISALADEDRVGRDAFDTAEWLKDIDVSAYFLKAHMTPNTALAAN